MSLIILADKVLAMTFTTLSVVLNVVGMLNNTFFSKDVRNGRGSKNPLLTSFMVTHDDAVVNTQYVTEEKLAPNN